MQPSSSSKERARWIGSFVFAATMSGTRDRASAMKPFMSAVPRP